MDASKVKSIIADHLGLTEEEILPETEFKDIGDSLDCLEIVMVFEDELNIEIPDSDITTIKTVQDIINYLQNK